MTENSSESLIASGTCVVKRGIPAWRLRALMATREISPTEVVTDAIERAESANAVLHNIMTICAGAALEQAAEAEKQILRGGGSGPLFGIPLTVKDLLWTKGVRTTGGSRLFEEWVPDVDALAVQRVKAAGGIIIGKGNTSEFGLFWRTRNRLMEECLNPWATGHVAGGSSGGDAASVASGVVPVALGTDRGGSGRIPAAWCGVVGLQSGFGVLESKGSVAESLFFSGVSPLATCARDLSMLYEVLSGQADGQARAASDQGQAGRIGGAKGLQTAGRSGVPRLTVGWCGDTGTGREAESSVGEACVDVVRAIGEAGADIAAVGWPDDASAEEAYWLLNDADRSAFLGVRLRAIEGWEEEVCDYVRDRMSHGKATSSAEVMRALLVRGEYQRRVSRIFEQVDFFLSPTVPITAPDLVQAEDVSRDQVTKFTWQVNFADLTAVSVPVSTVGGMPVGLQVIGRKGDERRLLGLCALIEEVRGGPKF